MPLLSFDSVTIAFASEPLLDGATFQVEPGERVCLIGRNGAGKSTLLKIAEGSVVPDGGMVWRQPGLRVAQLEQELPVADDATVFDVVATRLCTRSARCSRSSTTSRTRWATTRRS